MVLSSLLLALVSVVAFGSGPRDAATAPRIVAFGDSLTSGHGIGASRAFPAILQQRLDAAGLNYTIINAGVSGDTSTRALRRLDRALEGDVRIMVVALGAND